MRQLPQAVNAHRFLFQQAHDGKAAGMLYCDGIDFTQFIRGALAQQRRMRLCRRHAVIDDPRPRCDAGAQQVGLQIGRLQHWRGFGQRDQNHFRLFLVLQLHHRRDEMAADASLVHLARNIAVIRAGRVQQQQRMTGGGGVHHDELLACFADRARKSLEHGDFLGAGRAQIFFQQCASCRVELCALGGEYMLAVTLGLQLRIDPAHRQIVERTIERVGQMSGRVRRRQVDRQAATGQFDRHRSGHRGLADAAFTHQHHQAMAIDGDRVDQRGQAGRFEHVRLLIFWLIDQCSRIGKQGVQCIQSDQIEGLERDLIARQRSQSGWHCRQRVLLARANRRRQRIVLPFVLRFTARQHAVDDQVLLRQADRRQFFMRTGRLKQRGGLRAGDQHQARAQRIGQRLDGRLVLGALLFQPCQWAQARCIALAFIEKAAPRARQLQHPDRVSGRRRIEDDVIVIGIERRIGQQRGELVERGDLGRASAR